MTVPRSHQDKPSRRDASPRPRRAHSGRALVEQLETRQLLTYSATLAGNTATFTAATTVDFLQFTPSGGEIQHNTLTAPAGQSFADNLDLDSTLPGSQRLAAAATSTVVVGSAASTSGYQLEISDASALNATFDAFGNAGSSVEVDDSESSTGNTYSIGTSSIVGTGINVGLLGSPFGSGEFPVELDTSTGTNLTTVTATSSPTVVLGDGTDTIDVGNAGVLTGIAQPLGIFDRGPSASEDVTLDDSAGTTPANATLSDNPVTGFEDETGLAPATISFGPTMKTLVIDGSAAGGSQAVDLTNGDPLVYLATTYNGGGNNDLALQGTNSAGPVTNEVFSPTAPQAGNFSLDGSTLAITGVPTVDDTTPATNLTENYTGGTDSRISIVAGPTVGGLATTSVANLANTGQFPTENFANKTNVTINAGADDDVVNVDGAAILPGSNILIDGQGGTNVLNYNAGGQTVVITPTGTNPEEATITRPGSAPLTVQNFQTINVVNGQVQGIPVVGPFVSAEPAVAGFAGVPLVNVEVATVNDASTPNATAADFGATINWGDGTSSAGTLVADASNPTTFHVQGSHVYQTPSPSGGYVIAVTVTQKETDTTLLPPATITQTNTGGASTSADITEPLLSVAGTTIRGVAGSTLSGQVVATLDPTNPFDTTNGFPPAGTTASINWGDGTTTTGTIVANGGQFDIVGSHAYALPGSFPVVTTITGLGTGYPATLVAEGSSVIADAVLANSSPATPVAAGIEGTSFTGTFATFTDPNLLATAADFTALIHFGDGHSATGTVAADPTTPGQFLVTGTHTYAASGSYSATIDVQDAVASGGSTLAIARQVGVAAAAVDGHGLVFDATLGTPFTGVVSTFTSDNPLAVAADFTASVDFGDGTGPMAAQVVQAADGSFEVIGTHTYDTTLPSDTVQVTTTVGEAGNLTTIPSVATIFDAPLMGAGLSFSAIAGTPYTGAVATFTYPGSLPIPTSFSGTIFWGDGTTSPITTADVTTVATSPSTTTFSVVGTHTYDTFGQFSVGVSLTTAQGSTGFVASSATVADATLVDTTPASPLAGLTEGTPFTGTFATFTDPNLAALPSDFRAIINFGDGHAALGTVAAGSAPGEFVVTGTNTYAAFGNYSATISILDTSAAGGSSLTAVQPVAVVPAGFINTTGLTFPATIGTPFTGVVATFTSANPLATASEFNATVDFGDGTAPVSGTVVLGSGGVFDVIASHTYLSSPGAANPTVTTTIKEGVDQATAVGAADLSDAALTGSGIPIQAVVGALFSGPVATFTYPGGVTPPTNLSGTIFWGDGTTSPVGAGDIALVAGSTDIYTVTGSHTYARFGQFTVTTTLMNPGGNAQALVTSTATVADATLGDTTPPGPLSVVEGVPFTEAVGSFDPNPFATASDFVASVNFGDGHIAPGTITAIPSMPGNFLVTATNTYATAGSYQAQVTIADISAPGGSTLSFFRPVVVTAAILAGSGAPLVATPVVNVPFEGSVAHFISGNPLATPSDFAASITFGDGSAPVAGVITQASDGSFYVTGTHTYGQSSGFGAEAIQVGITELASGENITIPASAVISDAPVIGQGATITAATGDPLVQNAVATFTYGGSVFGADLPFSGTINWGDGTLTTINATDLASLGYSATGRTFVVTGSHTYETFGVFPVTVTLDAAGSSGVASGSAHVADDLTVSVPTITPALDGAFSGVVATITEAGSPGMLDQYAATVNFGDGSPAIPGTIVAGLNGTFLVLASHTYTVTPTLPVSVTVTDDLSGITTGTASAAVVLPPLPPPAPPVVSGQLDPASDTGESDTDAITDNNRPHFFGTATPGTAIFLYATPVGATIPVLLGSTTADATGAWGITSITLEDGKYNVDAIGIAASGTASTLDLILPSALQGPLTIDTAAPKVAFLQFEPLTGQVAVTLQDGLSGLDQATLADGANYTFTHIGNLPGLKPSAYKAGSPLAPAYVVTGVSVSPAASATSPQSVVVSIDDDQPIRGGFYRITIKSGGVEDVAGNALDGTYYGYFPSGNGSVGGDFVANLTSAHNTVLPALPVGTTASPLADPGTKPTSVTIPTVKPTKGKAVTPFASVIATAGQDLAPTTAVTSKTVKAHAAAKAKPAPHATANTKVHDAALAHLTVKEAVKPLKS